MHRKQERKMSKGRESVLNSTLLVASTIFCLVVAEAALRFFPVMSGLHALPVSEDSPVFRFSPNRDFVFSRGWHFSMINRGHVNNDGWVNNQDYRVSEYPPTATLIFADHHPKPSTEVLRSSLQGSHGERPALFRRRCSERDTE